MIIPEKIIDIDLFTKNREVYVFHRKVYKGCYEYRNYWINGHGDTKFFSRYLEKGNILYDAWSHRNMKNFKDYFSFEFEGEIDL